VLLSDPTTVPATESTVEIARGAEDDIVVAVLDPIVDKLDRLEAKPALVFDEIDFDMVDRDAVRARLADPLQYSQRVEAMVTGLSIETLLPRTSGDDGYIHRFLAVWEPDEQGHALALEALLRHLDLEPFPLPTEEPVPIHNRVAGLLGTLSHRMHQTVELMYHTVGAMNERLAFSAYERMGEILTELGEHGLVSTLMKPLRRDESAHLGYYRTAAREIRDTCDRWQLAAARNILVHTYAPVGAGDKRDKPAFARTIRAFGDSGHIVDKVQLIAESLLSADERRLPPFVQGSFDKCFDVATRGCSSS
jgi:hypothetical protein